MTSAFTTIVGLSMLAFSELVPSANAGRALAIALGIALLASLTLLPALASLMGTALFWPRRDGDSQSNGGGRLWQVVGTWSSARPVLVIGVVLALLVGPVWAGSRATFRYGTLGVMPDDTSSARGRAIAEAHFSKGRLFSWSIMVVADGWPEKWGDVEAMSREVEDVLAHETSVDEVWSAASPMGPMNGEGGALDRLMGAAVSRGARDYYFSAGHQAVRFEVMCPHEPLSDEAIELYEDVMVTLAGWSEARLGKDVEIRATGLTPYIVDIRQVTEHDHRRITTLVVAAVGLTVMIWLRGILMPLVMVAATLLVYWATLGVADAFFVHVVGSGHLDWKVRLFLFVVLVAVGQDYNVFLVSRLRQEASEYSVREAAMRAVAKTGWIISACGLIMAATLGSLGVTELPLLRELGFAFAFGILLDVFVVRPLLIPACFVLLYDRDSSVSSRDEREARTVAARV